MSNTPSNLDDIIASALETWGLSIEEVETSPEGESTYEVEVSVSGELLLDDVLDDHGTLLFTKNGAELTLKGFRDNRLLITARYPT